MDVLEKLCQWYESECNGDWEHSYGIKLETSDNPGWILTIDLNETYLIDTKNTKYELIRSEVDWIYIQKEGDIFRASCSINNLKKMISIFLKYTATHKLE